MDPHDNVINPWLDYTRVSDITAVAGAGVANRRGGGTAVCCLIKVTCIVRQHMGGQAGSGRPALVGD